MNTVFFIFLFLLGFTNCGSGVGSNSAVLSVTISGSDTLAEVEVVVDGLEVDEITRD